ncbi:MAG TPA: EamA family transporter [Tepidisphaeraceae bacterium]|jgi:drug/metabolite transporter (DMT)-like permease|nr:EamA family transporter [Tepidisphaeraceae bacterium]
MIETAALPTASRVRPRPRPFAWVVNPYLLIFVGAVLDTTGEVLLSKGSRLVANNAALTAGVLGWAAPLHSIWTWIGIVSYVLSLLTWLQVLRFVPLSIAFPLVNVVHVLVPWAAHTFLHETVPPRLWAGIGLIFVGILVIARPLMKVEEKL